ncbi:hypothetical protein, variant 1 [Aphanomyces astaci]|uniref:ATP-dependent RNA helicase n=1 Tax=Aphanomyces astaci TaxID=112090 RepID=W4H5Z9_APHAT|nr:hypothetical protein, variant 2 [Aphanomyces astaci]XP_009823806.1 hypothetical protein, variant 1 [Aphanomyces astaci]ETV87006.1 hypothetical protein, variant 1 [Aphanomyces astaci]ETV87007.1 hypothetical protein, variant 2 [Aphanomyces astaci]|eukprot:XP_009823805.1 hypothetical protein, variant 2 [Aphanomyces astaci]
MAKKQKRGPAAAKTTTTTMPAKKKFDKGWQRVDLSEQQMDGFDDGNAFELEELTDYTLEDDGFGGRVLIAGANNPSASKKEIKAPADKTSAVKAEPTAKATDKAATVAKNESSAKPDNKKAKKTTTSKSTEPTADNDTAVSKVSVSILSPSAAASSIAESGKKKKKRKRSKKATADDQATDATASDDEDDVIDHSAAIAAAAEEAIAVLPAWAKFKLHPTLNASLTRMAFTAPTLIQALTLTPAMIEQRDVVGAAPTGSGKTLAFGLPVLQYLLKSSSNEPRGKCRALILTPTRELAIQIVSHLQALIPDKRRIGIVSLVGGMAIQKQQRQLSYGPEIVVATPGRLWEVMESGETHHFDTLQDDLRFLIVDEADRMLQQGSFPQLETIFERVNKGKVLLAPKQENEDDDVASGQQLPVEASVIMLDDVLKQHANNNSDQAAASTDDDATPTSPPPKKFLRQTFLFSATMTLKNAGRYQTKKTKNPTALTMLESIMKRIGLRGKPAVVDLSAKESNAATKSSTTDAPAKVPRGGAEVTLPDGLELAQVECLDEHRNNVLYYFLTQYPGRTIVFLNAISGVRKLAGVLHLLKMPVFALHAEMQQKQRLKKLDQFRAHEKGILIATDVAARGLDIPSVDYVVHYHIPRSAETFVHRSGRTARASKHGLSISFVAPIDAKYHAQICNVLHRPSGFSMFPVDHKYVNISYPPALCPPMDDI